MGYQPSGQFCQNNQPISPASINGDKTLSLLLKAAALCNNAYLKQNEGNKQWEIMGDPTEGALLVAARKAGYQKEFLDKEYPRLKELPFDSDRKRMSTIHETPDGTRLLLVKGAIDQIVDRCVQYSNNEVELSWSDAILKKVFAQNNKLTTSALRVLALAYRELTTDEENIIKQNQKLDFEKTESGLIFLGLIAMADPPRLEAKEAVQKCQKAGIRPVMITGDFPLTAQAIAEQIGIYQTGDRIITGLELEKMSQQELE
ncbi:MAG TPA: HAD family hydrolase, partial [Atribacterota bacterium]|nr:HAD family hydrolase [Atribacterota bacterium]